MNVYIYVYVCIYMYMYMCISTYMYIFIYIHTYIVAERQVWKGKLPKDVTEDQVRSHLCLPSNPVEGSPPVPTHPRARSEQCHNVPPVACHAAGVAPPAVAAAPTATCRHVSAGERVLREVAPDDGAHRRAHAARQDHTGARQEGCGRRFAGSQHVLLRRTTLYCVAPRCSMLHQARGSTRRTRRGSPRCTSQR